MAEIRKNKREESVWKKRCEVLLGSQPLASAPTSTTGKKLESLLSLYSNDVQEVINACLSALSYLSDGTNDKIQAVIEAGVCRRLVELLLHTSPSVVILALRIVGKIVTGDDLQTQCIIEHRALTCLFHLLTNNHIKSISKKACWIISNITARNKEQIQSVMGASLIGPLVSLLQTNFPDLNKEAACALSNATSGGSTEQIKFLVSQGCIKPLCDLLVCDDPIIVTVSLEGLENILKAGEVEKKMGNYGESYLNHYAELINYVEGLNNIQILQLHHNKEVKEKAKKVLAANFFALK